MFDRVKKLAEDVVEVVDHVVDVVDVVGIEALHHEGHGDTEAVYEQTAHRADPLAWSSWVNSGVPLAIEIKTQLTERAFEGVSRVRSAGVTRAHLNELFEIIYETRNKEADSKLTEGTFDGGTKVKQLRSRSSCSRPASTSTG